VNLVIGASGSVGTRVVQRMLAAGEPVRGVTRDPVRLAGLHAQGLEVVRGDLRDTAWMPGALAGVRNLVLSSHALVPPSRQNHPLVTDAAGNRNMIDAAVAAGVQHIVFLSMANTSAAAPLEFARIKYGVEEYLRGCGATWSVVGPTVIIESHALLMQAEPLRTTGKVQFFGSGSRRLNWVAADDVADFVHRAVHEPALRNTRSAIGGPDVMSRLDVLKVVEELTGLTARRSHVPLPVIRILRQAIGPFHPGMRVLLDLTVAEDSGTAERLMAPAHLDWTGDRTVRDVVAAWAGAAVPAS
jgi:uncharacterized protein YbjT (DUF2867 family)